MNYLTPVVTVAAVYFVGRRTATGCGLAEQSLWEPKGGREYIRQSSCLLSCPFSKDSFGKQLEIVFDMAFPVALVIRLDWVVLSSSTTSTPCQRSTTVEEI